VWDRALPEKEMKSLSSGAVADRGSPGLSGSYIFLDSPPYQDATNSLPALSWTQPKPQGGSGEKLELDGKSWLTTADPVEKFNQAVLKSSQFTIHVLCTPAETKNASGVIVSLSRPDDDVNLHLRQDGRSVALWFRNPLSANRANLPLYVPFTFDAYKPMDIAASYNGSDAMIYLNGNRMPRSYRLTAGASLAHAFGPVQSVALTGYSVVYETLIFIPAGILIGLAARTRAAGLHPYPRMFALGIVLPSVLLEILLVSVGGGEIWFRDIVLSIFFGAVGILLVNGDRRYQANVRRERAGI
jgi:hypothetical protein